MEFLHQGGADSGESIFFLGGTGEKIHLDFALEEEIEIVGGKSGLILGDVDGADNIEDFFDGGEIEKNEIVGIDFATFVKKPAESGGRGGEVRFPVGIGQLPGAVLKGLLNRGGRGNIAFELAVGDIDILEREI